MRNKTQSYHFRVFIENELIGHYRIIKPSLPAAVIAFRKWFKGFNESSRTYRITASTALDPDCWEWCALKGENRG
jgi:hypothetical protein